MRLSKNSLAQYIKVLVEKCYKEYPFLRSEPIDEFTRKTLDKYLDSGLEIEQITNELKLEIIRRGAEYRERQQAINKKIEIWDAKQQEKVRSQELEKMQKSFEEKLNAKEPVEVEDVKEVNEQIENKEPDEMQKSFEAKLYAKEPVEVEDDAELRDNLSKQIEENLKNLEEQQRQEEIKREEALKSTKLITPLPINEIDPFKEEKLRQLDSMIEERSKKPIDVKAYKKEKNGFTKNNSERGIVSLFSISLVILASIAFILTAMILNVLLK